MQLLRGTEYIFSTSFVPLQFGPPVKWLRSAKVKKEKLSDQSALQLVLCRFLFPRSQTWHRIRSSTVWICSNGHGCRAKNEAYEGTVTYTSP